MSIDIMSTGPVPFTIEAVIHDDFDRIPMYVVDSGRSEPLTVSMQPPPQNWKAIGSGRGEHVYLITPYTGPGTYGFSWDGEAPAPGAPIIMGEPRPFTLTWVSAEIRPGHYWYQPGTDAGSGLYVGRDPQSEELRIYSFPAGTPSEKKPTWKCSPP